MKFTPSLSECEVEAAFQGRFNSLLFVAEGGQGVVMKARNGKDSTPIALKMYFPGGVDERAKREVEALRRMDCPTLVRLWDAGNVVIRGANCLYVATEFVTGKTLSSNVYGGSLSLDSVARIGCDIAVAIDALWSERIVHRDIKPPNIVLSESNGAVLIDLGVARHLSLNSLTTAGKTWGTDGYMSPEHAQARRQLSCKSDVFALGIVLQECIFGRHPTGRNQLALDGGGPRTNTLAPSVPAAFATVVDSMVDRRPHMRPAPNDVARALSSLVASLS
ncbi:MAG: serine/threonine protein kinase [Verrucomicrobiaceae bacterium]|nr:MAG: serine/threonine protein kinase [Verrucomicrobiaceae bacterium]